jgi:hypothetical protein
MTSNNTTLNKQCLNIFSAGVLISAIDIFSNNKNKQIIEYLYKESIYNDDFYRVYSKLKSSTPYFNDWNLFLNSKDDFIFNFIVNELSIIGGFLGYKNQFLNNFLTGICGGLFTFGVKNLVKNNATILDFLLGFSSTFVGLKVAEENEIDVEKNDLHNESINNMLFE